MESQCYLPPGRGDIPALTPAEAGTRLSNPRGMQGIPYSSALYCANQPSLQQCCNQQARKFFKSILRPDSCLQCLLPAPCDKDLRPKLQVPRKFPALASHIKRLQLLIYFGLLHYQ